MPVYEISPIVIEIGSVYSKVGFVAEPYPRAIVPSTYVDAKTGNHRKLFEYNTEQEFYDQMVTFIQTVFFKHILVSPKERKVVIVESVLCPTNIRETIAKVLFRHFEVTSILFAPSHLVVLSTLAIDTAIVIDMGFKETTVIPVYSGVQVLQAWQAQPIAAETVHEKIKSELIKCGINENILSDEVIENIKVRLCFVTTSERAEKFRANDTITPCSDVDYPIEGKQVIKVPGVLRETAYEILFPDDNEHTGLPYIILDSILQCPIDMRKKLFENLLLIGGTSMVVGLKIRLKAELLKLLNSNYYKDRLFLNSTKFHNVPAKPNFASWLGGSIYGGTELLQTRSLTKEVYAQTCRIPDWVNIADTRTSG